MDATISEAPDTPVPARRLSLAGAKLALRRLTARRRSNLNEPPHAQRKDDSAGLTTEGGAKSGSRGRGGGRNNRPAETRDSCEEARGHRPDAPKAPAGNKGREHGERRAKTDFCCRSSTDLRAERLPARALSEVGKAGQREARPSSGFSEKYKTCGKVLGRGSYATVRLVSERCPDQQGRTGMYACKELTLAPDWVADADLDDDGATTWTAAKQEVELLCKLNHPNILSIRDVYVEADRCYIITPVLYGGDLLDAQRIRGSLAEEDARLVMRSVFSALEYLHAQGIAHCDVKLENIMLESASDFDNAKLIDFGLAKHLGQGCLTSASGTPLYVAPETLNYVQPESKLSWCGVQCDMWACGVVLYALLGGAPPFVGDSFSELFKAISCGEFRFTDPAWEMVSTEAKDLIVGLLTTSPEQRLTAPEALQHPWMLE